jgi:hypothetical protein
MTAGDKDPTPMTASSISFGRHRRNLREKINTLFPLVEEVFGHLDVGDVHGPNLTRPGGFFTGGFGQIFWATTY